MSAHNNIFEKVKLDLAAKHIDVSKPGFYDDPNFIENEKVDSKFLENYAKFVQYKEYKDEYKNHAQKVLSFVAELLYEELKTDGRQNACVDMAVVLSRILEAEGVWNYIVLGGLTIDFPKNSGLSQLHYWPISSDTSSDSVRKTASHAWCVVPPFGVVDLTIKQQGLSNKYKTFIPDYIISNKAENYSAKIEDLVDDMVRITNRGKPISYFISGFQDFTKIFKPIIIKKEATFKYIPTAISAPDMPLEKIKGLKLNGMYGKDLYEQKIKPVLQSI